LGKSLGKLERVKYNFDRKTGLKQNPGYETKPSLSKDLKKVLEELNKVGIFETVDKRTQEFSTLLG
uniref:Uncharacterized protein n=1 Tax=Amphimedon queenslandica TaxID=400682 RepID=A0A1X7TZ99_AMPQE